MQIKGEENVAIVEVCVVGSIRMVEGRRNVGAWVDEELMRNIRSGPKKA